MKTSQTHVGRLCKDLYNELVEIILLEKNSLPDREQQKNQLLQLLMAKMPRRMFHQASTKV